MSGRTRARWRRLRLRLESHCGPIRLPVKDTLAAHWGTDRRPQGVTAKKYRVDAGLARSDELNDGGTLDTQVRSPHAIFNMPQRLLVPLFQRPYIWNRQDQWEPLWRDVERVANRLLRPETVDLQPHFLGAVVLQQLPNPSGDFQVRTIIDGQQRLTTLQLMLDAFHAELMRVGAERPAARLLKLVRNDEEYCNHDEDQFKVWPTNRDRPAFQEVMAAELPVDYQSLAFRNERLPQAHQYFAMEAAQWLTSEGPDAIAERAEALERAGRELMQLVVIDLASDENAQEIFETLNSRGAQLSAADLIKNFVFQRLLDEGADTEAAYEQYWKQFETAFWEEEDTVGRLRYPRSSMFLNSFLVSRLGEPVAAQEVFSRFKIYALHEAGVSMLDLIKQIHRAAAVYEELIKSATRDDSAITRRELFAYRMQQIDVDVIKALVLTLLDPEEPPLPQERLDGALVTIESFLVRRLLVRATTKNYNRLFAQAIAELRKGGRAEADTFLRRFFADQTADSTYWPDDAEVRREVRNLQIYRRLKRQRVRILLEALEDHRRGFDVDDRAVRTEQRCPRGTLTIEHICPQQWQDNWPLQAGEDEARRNQMVQTLGNLTLLTSRLNTGMSNYPWVGENSKREALREHSLLRLTDDVLEAAGDDWDVEKIEQRTVELTEQIIRIWPVPEGHAVNFQQTAEQVPTKGSVYLADLLGPGLVEPGDILHPTRPSLAARRATVLSDGRIEIDTGQVFKFPSGAAKGVSGTTSEAGWEFWLHERSGRTLTDLRSEYLSQFEIEDDDLEPDDTDDPPVASKVQESGLQ